MEYSSGRNKTFLCYLVDTGKADEGLQRGYLEDEHTGSHAEEAFFTQCLPHYDPALKYTITWYTLLSPVVISSATPSRALSTVVLIQPQVYVYINLHTLRAVCLH